MRRFGIGLLLTAVVVSVIFTSIFGTQFFTELSSWLMIAVGLTLAGLLSIGIGRRQPHPESGLT